VPVQLAGMSSASAVEANEYIIATNKKHVRHFFVLSVKFFIFFTFLVLGSSFTRPLHKGTIFRAGGLPEAIAGNVFSPSRKTGLNEFRRECVFSTKLCSVSSNKSSKTASLASERPNIAFMIVLLCLGQIARFDATTVLKNTT
jgi:hypothetical protein